MTNEPTVTITKSEMKKILDYPLSLVTSALRDVDDIRHQLLSAQARLIALTK